MYIETDPEIAYARMQHRHRSEEAGVSLPYLQFLDNCHREWIAREYEAMCNGADTLVKRRISSKLMHIIIVTILSIQIYVINGNSELAEVEKKYQECVDWLHSLVA